jgi:hypothetical protein
VSELLFKSTEAWWSFLLTIALLDSDDLHLPVAMVYAVGGGDRNGAQSRAAPARHTIDFH